MMLQIVSITVRVSFVVFPCPIKILVDRLKALIIPESQPIALELLLLVLIVQKVWDMLFKDMQFEKEMSLMTLFCETHVGIFSV